MNITTDFAVMMFAVILCAVLVLPHAIAFHTILPTRFPVQTSLRMTLMVPATKPMAVMARVQRLAPMKTVHRPTGPVEFEVCTVLDHPCVVRKGRFEAGDLCIYFSVGSVFPWTHRRTKFLDNCPVQPKTVNHHASEGLLGDMSWMRKRKDVDVLSLEEGQDVTGLFGIMASVSHEEAHLHPNVTEVIRFKRRSKAPVPAGASILIEGEDYLLVQHEPFTNPPVREGPWGKSVPSRHYFTTQQ